MKKSSFLFVAGALLAFASCQNNAADTGDNQAQIDSAVNARVEELRMQMMMQNDSIINAEAQRRADSIVAEMKGGSSAPARKSTNTQSSPNTNTKEETATTPTNPKEGRFNGDGNSNTTKKESRFNEDAAQKQKEENAKKKAERFK